MPRHARPPGPSRAKAVSRAADSVSAGGRKPPQRERLVEAMIELAAQAGYQAVSVAEVTSRAGVSSATFYEQFEDKEDCFLAAYRSAVERVFSVMQVPDGDQDWVSAARGVLAGLLNAVHSEPNGGRVLLIEALAGGPRLREERERVLRELDRRSREFLDGAPPDGKTLDVPAEALIGAVRSIVSRHLRSHGEDRLPTLVEDLLAWLESYARPAALPRWSTGARALLPAAPAPEPSLTAGAAPAQPARLPRGRHGLPMAVVARSQRTRIIHGTAEVVMAKGYADVTVADIVAAAGVSRDVFYEHFANKPHAFLAAQQFATQDLLDACASAYFSGESWPQRVWSALRMLLAAIAANPALAHLRIVECYPAGAAAIEQTATLTRIATIFLQEGYRHRPQAASLPRLCSHAITGAVFDLLYGHIARGDVAQLPRHLPQLTYIAIAPFTGPEEAIRLVEQMSAAPPR